MPLSRPAGVAMLGPPTLRWLARPIGRSIEELAPPDHVYRFLDATLDLSFGRAWVQELCAERGRPTGRPQYATATADLKHVT